jgi:hypothetical protein
MVTVPTRPDSNRSIDDIGLVPQLTPERLALVGGRVERDATVLRGAGRQIGDESADGVVHAALDHRGARRVQVDAAEVRDLAVGPGHRFEDADPVDGGLDDVAPRKPARWREMVSH